MEIRRRRFGIVQRAGESDTITLISALIQTVAPDIL